MAGESGSGAGTGIPVFVMLPLEILNGQNQVDYEVRDPSFFTGPEYQQFEKEPEKALLADLIHLQSAAEVTGLMVDCWWGRVEAAVRGRYNWDGYANLFSIVKAAKLQLHVVMSFHACLENEVETIPLPGWVKRIGQEKDLFYKDAHDDPSTEYLSWAVDDKDVLEDDQSGNKFTPLQVYKEFMIGFNTRMGDYFEEKIIKMIEVGLGPSGELRYPAYRWPWTFNPTPGVGEFQCYDKYMMERWKEKSKSQNLQLPQGVGPQTAGEYNSKPEQTLFFEDQPEQPERSLIYGPRYWDDYGKSFLTWYSGNLVAHGKEVLQIAKDVFQYRNVKIAAKVPGIHWYFNSENHAAEATAGLFTGDPKDNLFVYKSIAEMLESLEATFIFTCAEMKDDPNKEPDEPHKLVVKVLQEAQLKRASIACENGSEAYDKGSYDRILGVATKYEISYFTYMRLCRDLMTNFAAFDDFVKKMKAIPITSPQGTSTS